MEMFDGGAIRDAGGLKQAIEEDWQPNKEQARTIKQAKKEDLREKIRLLELERQKIAAVLDEKVDVIFKELVAEQRDVIDELVASTAYEDSFYREYYKKGVPFFDQNMSIQSIARPKIKEQFPDRFKDVDAERETKVHEIDEQIESLQKGLRGAR